MIREDEGTRVATSTMLKLLSSPWTEGSIRRRIGNFLVGHSVALLRFPVLVMSP